MLSLWKLRVGAEAYYLSQVARGIDDYYSGNGESQGRWIGTGSTILNLGESVTGDDLRAVLAGLVPGTGLSPNGTQIRPFKGRVPGFDLTFSAPKSVSVLYAFADPLVRAEVTEAVDAAVATSLSWLEREACLVRRGSNNSRAKPAPFERWGTQRLPGAGFIAAAFRHRTSRAGDPQLHVHVLLANLTRGPDGRWTALDGQALYRAKLAAGVVFQTALREELTRRLGVRWRPIHEHVADIAGIPKRVLSHFSKRRNEIEDELERSGLSGAAAAAQVTLATRTSKVELDQETLDERWIDDGATIGFGPEQIDTLLAASSPTAIVSTLDKGTKITVRETDPDTGEVNEKVLTLDEFAMVVAGRLPERDAAVTRFEVQNEVSDALAGYGGVAVLERLTDYVLAHGELIPLPRPASADIVTGWEQRWTTRRMVQIEADVRAMVSPVRVDRFAFDPATVDDILGRVDAGLGDDQTDMVRRICTQGLAVELVVGRAGTGKTYAMDAARQVFAAHGRRLIGVCPTAKAARELADGAHIETYTVPRLLLSATVGADDVIVVDEAGMCGTRDLHSVLTLARTAGAKVILVGDHRQLPEVAAGGGFSVALDAVGDWGCELTVNRRQDEVWEHEALDHLRAGDVGEFWEKYRSHGRIRIIEDRAVLHVEAIDAWWQHYSSGADAHLIAGTRAESRLLNQLARERLAAHGGLTGPTLAVGDRVFQAGDRVVLLRNRAGQTDLNTRRRCRVNNADIGTINAVRADGTIDLTIGRDRRVRLTAEYVQAGWVDHGYATTIHKAQGVTCDHMHVVGPAGLYRESAYVALSRARRSAHLYATTRQAAAFGEPAHTTGIPHVSERVDDLDADITEAISTSRAKTFITNEHPDLARIADLAQQHDLATLNARLRYIRDVSARLAQSGTPDTGEAVHELDLAERHRRFMRPGGRVNARDFDNVGTIALMLDHSGEAVVDFVNENGHRATRRLPWHLLKPIDHPEPAPLTATAAAYLDARGQRITARRAAWNDGLAAHGVGINEAALTVAAIDQREEQLARSLRAMPPAWLTWWAGERPDDPIAAVVYDDHIRDLARWRDTHQLPNDIAAYGPPPTNTALLDQWRQHTDQALVTRRYLLDTTPPTDTITPLDAARVRARLDELDALIATAPADQQLVINQLLAAHGDDLTDVVDALVAAADRQQDARRDWILEHWPNIVEHHELTALVAAQPPLAHWPTQPSQIVIQLLEELADRTASDNPEMTPLPELERLALTSDRDAELDRLRDERTEVGRELQQLAAAVPPGPTAAELARHQRARLNERAREIEAALRRLEARATLATWTPQQDPELNQRIERRVAYLVHAAATEPADWIVEVIEAAVDAEPEASIESIIDVACEVAMRDDRTCPAPPVTLPHPSVA